MISIGSQFRQQEKWIERAAVLPCFEVQVASGNPAGSTHQGYHLSPVDPVTCFNQQMRTMRIIGCQAPAVIDCQQHSITTSSTTECHFPCSSGMYGSADFSIQVHPCMKLLSSGQWLLPATERRGQSCSTNNRQRPDQPPVGFIKYNFFLGLRP